ncbi:MULTISPECIES: hypothetical protein [Pseudonocardia]|uniref:hypothetical protein n=1 Tax=Pseudonocardia TaxID=1847 RepID=UPI00307E23E4
MTTATPQPDVRTGELDIAAVERPNDLAAIHLRLCQAAAAAGADSMAGKSLAKAAAVASTLHFTWTTGSSQDRDPLALDTVHACLRSLFTADLTNLGYGDTDLPYQWIRQLRMVQHQRSVTALSARSGDRSPDTYQHEKASMSTDADSHSTHIEDPAEPYLSESPAALPLIQRPETNWLCALLATVLTLGMSVHVVIGNAGSGLPDMAPERLAGGLLLIVGLWGAYEVLDAALQWGFEQFEIARSRPGAAPQNTDCRGKLVDPTETRS